MGPWDEAIFHLINVEWRTPLLDPVFVIFSQATLHWLVRIGLALVVALIWLKRPSLRTPLAAALLAFLLSNGASDLLKNSFPMNRPLSNGVGVHLVYDFLVKHKEIVLTSPGTVSAHAANTAALATVFVLFFGPPAWPWIGVSFLTGLSRIYVGAHYPSQVLFGWVCGFLIGGGIALGCKKLQARRAQNG